MPNAENNRTAQTSPDAENVHLISPASEIAELEDGFSAVRYDGDYGFDEFLAGGGASSDGEVVEYLANNLLSNLNLGDLLGGIFGCSTIAVQSPDGDALYAPLDGMNEAGLAVSVNMIQDSAVIEQNTDKPDITTTTAIRLLLDKAGSVDEALELLRQYDLHGSMGMMIHFAIADSAGRSVAVEYVDNEMVITETPVLTNFYLAEGEKQGIGTEQSHERYDILRNKLEETPQMEMEDVRDALDRVSKDNFGEFESTEWSIVMNLSEGEARYYHRENYNRNYTFRLESR